MNLRTDVAREPNNTGISVGLGASDVKKILDDMINEKTAKDEDVNAMLDDVLLTKTIFRKEPSHVQLLLSCHQT